MPIIASLGALSYNHSLLNPFNYEYWYYETDNNVTFKTCDLQSNNLFVAGQDANQKGIIVKIDVGNPTINQIYSAYLNSGSSNNAFVSDIVNIKINSTKVYLHGETYNDATNSIGVIVPLDVSVNAAPGSIQSFREAPWAGTAQTTRRIIDSTGLTVGSAGNFYYIDFGSNRLTISRSNDNWSGLFPVGPHSSISITPPSLTDIPASISVNNAGTSLYVGALTTVRKFSTTPVGSPSYLPVVWSRTGFGNSFITDTTIDNAENVYVLASSIGAISGTSYVAKLDLNGNLLWSNSISSCQVKSIKRDGSGNIIVVGRNISNNLVIFKFDNSGNLLWQNKLSGLSFDGKDVVVTSSYIYVVGTAGSKGFIIKVPDDGSIPGDGIFTINGNTLTYQVGTQTIATSTNISAGSATITGFAQSPGDLNRYLLDNTLPFKYTPIT